MSHPIQNIITFQGILPLYFHPELDISLAVLQTIASTGLQAVEYTNRGERAYENFKAMVAHRDSDFPKMKIGIGTIKSLNDTKKFLNIGADFIVSPGFVPDIAKYCIKNNIFYAPGCMTPTEIIAAENMGIKFIKIFPGNILGPDFVRSIKDIFPNLIFMPTGGVDPTFESINTWMNAGVSVVGIGSKLISKNLMDKRDFVTLKSELGIVFEMVNLIKSQKQ